MFEWLKSSKQEMTSGTGTVSEVEQLTKALESIIKVTNHASFQTKRLKYIRGRAKCALYGGDVYALDYPTNRYKPSSRKPKSR